MTSQVETSWLVHYQRCEELPVPSGAVLIFLVRQETTNQIESLNVCEIALQENCLVLHGSRLPAARLHSADHVRKTVVRGSDWTALPRGGAVETGFPETEN